MAEPRDQPEPRPHTPADRIDRVGATLRKVFDDAAAEPLPRAFEDLLRQLR